MRSRNGPRAALACILLAYVVVALVYSAETPLFESADEISHYSMVQYLATHHLSLPPQDPAHLGTWRQAGSQPPLYYMLAALLTAPIDTADMPEVMRPNTHGLGVSYAGAVANAVVHNPAKERFPWEGTALAVHVARALSVLLGLGTVTATYCLARELLPERQDIALGAAALNGFLPMFLLISGSVNNDNLANFLGNLGLLALVRLLKAPRPPRWPAYLALGAITGLGLLSKLSLGLLVPLIALCLLTGSIRWRDWRPLAFGLPVVGALAVAIAGWWYWRNYQLYGDPTGLKVFLDIVGRHNADWAQLWGERGNFITSYWGFTGAIHTPLPAWVYATFDAIAIVGVLGAVAYLAEMWRGSRRTAPTLALGLAVSLVWVLATFASMLRWSLMTPAMQGRLTFPALSGICLWLALGLAWWPPRRWAALSLGASSACFLGVAVAAPYLTIAPAFALPPNLRPGASVATFGAPGQGEIGLLGATLGQDTGQPGQYLDVSLDWQVLEETPQSWSLFLHLVNPEGVIVAQRDLYPGGGKMLTSDLAAGRSWRDVVKVLIPPGTYAPSRLRVLVGWYRYPDGERLAYAPGQDAYPVGEVALAARPSQYGAPNPVSVNFDDRVELLGYDITDLAFCPGQSLDATLYWHALRPLDKDYVVFTNIIDSRDLTKYADSNTMPANGARPTSGWAVGEVVEDKHALVVRADAAPGIYDVEVGLFTMDDGYPRLDVISEGRHSGSAALLTRVRIRDRSECAAP
ncbi:MAG: glycosyltransferase family 39 protein [Anaerolineae bacterium]